MYSIRRRLTIVLAAGFVFLIFGAGLVMAEVIGAHMTGEFDQALEAKARALIALTEVEGGQIEFDYAPEYMPEFERREDPDYFQFWLDDGRVLLRSSRLDGDLPVVPSRAGTSTIRDVRLPDGRAGRLVQVAFVPRGPGDVGAAGETPLPALHDPEGDPRALVLVVARGRGRLDRLLGGMRLAIFGIGGLAVLLAALLVWRTLALGFSPIAAIAGEVERLDAHRLGSRVHLPRTPRELAPIVDQLNALLGRLDQAFARERRFTGNVAHELRTPIAELGALAAVGARWPRDEGSVAGFFRDVAEISKRMERLVADLFLLARCQAGVERAVRAPARLRDVVASAWAQRTRAAQQKGIELVLDVPEDLVLDTDAGKLEIVLANLLGNAVAYAPADTEVRCTARLEGRRFELVVENRAERLPPEAMARLTEPFWRGDPARTDAEHAGLGLALVAALATLLDLGVDFRQAADGTFGVRLTGAAAPPAGTGSPLTRAGRSLSIP